MKSHKIVLVFLIGLFISCYKPEPKPKDFNIFWENTLNELNLKPIDYKVVKDTFVDNKKWTLNKINSFQGIHFYAWVSEPTDDKKYPIKIKFSGFGRGNTNRNKPPHSWFLKEKKSINMVVDIRGQGSSTEQIKFKGYLTKGLENKDEYIYRGAFMDAVRAVDFIADHPKSDSNIIVEGNEQGGALSIVATALNPKVTLTTIGFPFLTDMYNYDKEKWPMKIFIHQTKQNEIGFDELHHTLSYFDMLNFAEKIHTPVFIRTHDKDSVTPKEGVIKFFDAIKSKKKQIHIDDCKGRGCSSKSEAANRLELEFVRANIKSN